MATKEHPEKSTENVEKSVVQDEKKKVTDFNTILIEELCDFGIYQFRTMSILAVIVIFIAFAGNEYVFTAARIPTRCFIPECDAPTPEFSPEWLHRAIPVDSHGKFDNCQRFALSNVSTTSVCTAEAFNRNSTVPCEGYLYENTNTVVYDYELACDEWRRSFIGSARTFGTLLVLPLTGFISDKWGRRTALTINVFNTAWMGVARFWANTYVGFMISELAEATFGSGSFSTVYILVMEMVGAKYRVAAGATINSFFSIGLVLMGLIAWKVPNWRYLTLALYVPQLMIIFCFFAIFESVRWYMSKGRYADSERVLREIAKINNKTLSEKTLEMLRKSEEAKTNEKTTQVVDASEPWLPVLVFRYKPILLRCLVCPVWWITLTFIYYGMSINSVNMSGNSYVNYIAVSAVEIPGFWTSTLVMDKIGRKSVLITAFWMCAACQFGYIFIPASIYWASLTVYLIGKYSIAMVTTSVYVYTSELYPTQYRHSLFAFSSMVGRIGSILAPLTPALADAVWEGLPTTMFGCFALLSGLLVLTTPETLGCSMPDSMEDACRIGKVKPKKYVSK